MLHVRPSLVLAALALVLPAVARAREPGPPVGLRWEGGVHAGARFFGDDNALGRTSEQPKDLAPRDGLAAGLRLGLNLDPRFAVEGELQITPTRTRNGATSMNVLAYRLHALYHFLEGRRLRVFGVAGLGAVTSMVSDPMVVESDTDPMFHIGLGAKVTMGGRWGLRFDLRGQGPMDLGDESRYGSPDFEILVGPYYTFGTAVAVRQVVAPVLDPDRDGLLEPQDRCPAEAEDVDGFEDADGCPDPDNDADGVPDAKDRCPPQPETRNGFEDGDGCPDELPPALEKFSGVIEGINFELGKALILRDSYAILDRAARVLKEFPEIRLEVSGHTDNTGSPAYNKELSQKRAEAVKDYLVGRGIDAARLTAVGYGMDRPLGPNDTPQGRAKNRRTEFKLTGE